VREFRLFHTNKLRAVPPNHVNRARTVIVYMQRPPKISSRIISKRGSRQTSTLLRLFTHVAVV